MRTRVIIVFSSLAALVALGSWATDYWQDRKTSAARNEAAFRMADEALAAAEAGDVDASGYLADAVRMLREVNTDAPARDAMLVDVLIAWAKWRDAAMVLERLHLEAPDDLALAERTADAFQKAWRLRRTDDLYARCLRSFSDWKRLAPGDPRPVLATAAVRVEAWTRQKAFDQKRQALAGLQEVIDRWPGTPEAAKAAEVQEQLDAAGLLR